MEKIVLYETFNQFTASIKLEKKIKKSLDRNVRIEEYVF